MPKHDKNAEQVDGKAAAAIALQDQLLNTTKDPETFISFRNDLKRGAQTERSAEKAPPQNPLPASTPISTVTTLACTRTKMYSSRAAFSFFNSADLQHMVLKFLNRYEWPAIASASKALGTHVSSQMLTDALTQLEKFVMPSESDMTDIKQEKNKEQRLDKLCKLLDTQFSRIVQGLMDITREKSPYESLQVFFPLNPAIEWRLPLDIKRSMVGASQIFDKQGKSFIEAVRRNNVAGVTALFQTVPFQNIRKQWMDQTISDEETKAEIPLLIYAVDKGYARIVDAFLNQRWSASKRTLVNMEARTESHGTALLAAAYNASVRAYDMRDEKARDKLRLAQGILRSLLLAKANINAQNNSGQTVLHCVAESKRRTVEDAILFIGTYLLDEGADSRLQNAEGKTPAEIAFYPEVRAYINLYEGAHRPAGFTLTANASKQPALTAAPINRAVVSRKQEEKSTKEIVYALFADKNEARERKRTDKESAEKILADLEKIPQDDPAAFIAAAQTYFPFEKMMLTFDYVRPDLRFQVAKELIHKIVATLDRFDWKRDLCVERFKNYFTDEQLCQLVDHANFAWRDAPYRQMPITLLLHFLPRHKILQYALRITPKDLDVNSWHVVNPWIDAAAMIVRELPQDLRMQFIQRLGIQFSYTDIVENLQRYLSREEIRALLLPVSHKASSRDLYESFDGFYEKNILTIEETIKLIDAVKPYVQCLSIRQGSRKYIRPGVEAKMSCLDNVLAYLSIYAGNKQVRTYLLQIMEELPETIVDVIGHTYATYFAENDWVPPAASATEKVMPPSANQSDVKHGSEEEYELHYFIRECCGHNVRQCLEKGIAVNIRDRKGQTPLITAVQFLLPINPIHQPSPDSHQPLSHKLEIAQLLLKRRDIDVNATDHYGLTALFYAVRHGFAGIVQCLLQRDDIRIDAVCRRTGDHFPEVLLKPAYNLQSNGFLMEETAFLCAVRHGHVEVAKVFLECVPQLIPVAESERALRMAEQNHDAAMMQVLSIYRSPEPDNAPRPGTPSMG